MKNCIVVLSVLAAVFFVIALPTFLCGCHRVIQPNCLRYFVELSEVSSYRVDTKFCSEFIKWDRECTEESNGKESCTNSCGTYRYYDCYYSYVIMNTNSSKACEISVVVASEDKDAALKAAMDEYPLHLVTYLFIDKNTSECFTQTNAEALAITGLVFFCLVGVVVSLIIFSIVYGRREKSRLR